MSAALFRVDPRDDVAVALRDLAAGEALNLVIAEPIPKGHKVALRAIAAGEAVHKYRLSDRARADRHRRRRARAQPQSRDRAQRARRLCLDAGRAARARAGRRGGRISGLSPRRRPGRHAQRNLGDPDGRLRRPHGGEDRGAGGRAPRGPRRRHPRLRPSVRLLAARRRSGRDARACSPRSPAIPMRAAC